MDSRDKRRGTAHLTGIGAGAVVGLIAFAIIDVAGNRDSTIWWWLAAAVAGAICGGVLGLLFNATREDGEDDEQVANDIGRTPGRADAPVEGAVARDAATHRSADRRRTGSR